MSDGGITIHHNPDCGTSRNRGPEPGPAGLFPRAPETRRSLDEVKHLLSGVDGEGMAGIPVTGQDVCRHLLRESSLSRGTLRQQRQQQILQRDHPDTQLNQLGIR